MKKKKEFEQMSMFAVVGEYETPLLPVEERMKGVKAWVIEVAGFTNSFDFDAPVISWGVRARRVAFTVDAKPDLKSRSGWCTGAESCDGGPYFGWLGGLGDEPIFAKRPTFTDMECFVRKKKEYSAGTKIETW